MARGGGISVAVSRLKKRIALQPVDRSVRDKSAGIRLLRRVEWYKARGGGMSVDLCSSKAWC